MKRCLGLFTVFANASAVHITSLVADVQNDAAEYENDTGDKDDLEDGEAESDVAADEEDDDDEDAASFEEAEEDEDYSFSSSSGTDDADEAIPGTRREGNIVKNAIAKMNAAMHGKSSQPAELVEPAKLVEPAAELVESTSVGQIAPFNMGTMLNMIVKESTGTKARLLKQQPAEKAKVPAARKIFFSKQKTIGSMFRLCKLTIKKKSPDLNAKQCVTFKKIYYPKGKATFGSVQTSLAKLRKREDADNQAAFLRAKNAYKEFKQQIKGCKYKIKLLPKVISKIKPILTLIMGKMKIGTGSSGAKAVKSAPKIADPQTMKKFMNLKLHAAIGPPLTKIFGKIEDKIWTAVRPLVDAVKGVLMELVGLIPFVGGVLSFVVSNVFERIVSMLEGLVNKKLDGFRELLENKAVAVAMKLSFKRVKGVVTFVKRSAGKLKTACLKATKGINKQITAAYKKQHQVAVKAEVPHSEIIADAKKMRR